MSDQHLIGTELDDLLVGAEGNDWLEGLGGNDTLNGDSGADLLEGGDGDDTLAGGSGDDILDGGTGSDTVILAGAPGAVLVDLGAGYTVDAEGTDTLISIENAEGGDFGDRLFGSAGANRLSGMGGDDVLWGLDGDDYLDGGTGTDSLNGGSGNDVYALDAGGDDRIWDFQGDDEVHWQGVSPDQVERIRPGSWNGNSNDLILRIAGTADTLTLSGFFFDSQNQVERVVFDDGTVWTAEEAQSLRILGTPGDDFLWGSQFGETIYARGGNDQLNGWLGDDVYEMGPGLGFDFITDGGGNDEVRFGAGVVADELERSRDWSNGDLILHLPNTMAMGEGLRIAGWFNSPENQVERFVFDDGTVWTAEEAQSLRILGTPGDDFLWGSQFGETIYARGGNDQLNGWLGDDVYEMGPGLGFDFITDGGGNDEVRFGAGVVADELERSRDWSNGDLILHLPNTMAMGEGLRIAGWFNSPENQVERFVFDDGTVWTAEEAQSLRILGTPGDDFLWGSQFGETIYARGGNDQLNGWLGDDVYEMGPGLGFDFITDGGGNDEVRFGAGVVADELERSRDWSNGDLILHLPNTMAMGEGLRIAGWFNSPENQVERFVFDDGTVWTAEEAQSLRILGTPGDDFLWGSQFGETIYARGGNDQLNGWLGDDVYEMGPGLGFDFITDDGGNDEVRFGAGVVADELERSRDWSNGDLILHLPNTMGMGEGLRIAGWFNSPENQVERFVFDDGTVWTAEEAQSLRILGTPGDDFLWGSQFGETIYARGGNDQLNGWLGDDVYEMGPSVGFDYVVDGGGDDEIRLGAGVDPDQIQRFHDTWTGDLVLSVPFDFGPGAVYSLRIGGWFNSPENQIERIVFEDGTVWDPATASGEAPVNHAPVVSSPIADQNAAEFAGFSFTLPAGTFADTDTGDTLTLSARLVGGDPLPAWLSFDGATSTFTGTPPGGTAGSLSVEVLAIDEGGLTAADQFDITIENGVNFIPGTDGDDVLVGTAGDDWINGSGGNDELWGLEGDDDLWGDYSDQSEFGNDTIYGGAGNDFLAGVAGNDLLVGGTGDDSYQVESAGATVVENYNEGYDDVLSTIDYALPENVEQLRIVGSAVYATGNWLDNRIFGNFGNNVIDGGEGADSMEGSLGNDTYIVDNGGDRPLEYVGQGIDTVFASVNYSLYYATYPLMTELENLVLTGEALNGWGNDLANVITGNELGNNLYGLAGSDTLYGMAGDDYLNGGEGNDRLDGGDGNDYVVDSGDGNDRLIGGAGDDFMVGLGGDDVYEPGPGQDIVFDTYGDDEVRMAPGVDPDQVERIHASSGLSLELRVAGTGDSVSLYNWFHDPNYRIERIVFDDGTVWTIEDTESLRILGTAGDDPGLVGSVWSERIEGFTGNDYVLGDAGNDVIVLQGDLFGFDWVRDSAGDDEVQWQGVDASQVERIRSNSDLVLTVAATGQQLTLASWFTGPSYQIERIVFDDGTVWSPMQSESLRLLGTPGDDVLIGTQWSERLEGFGGNDRLDGGGGQDTMLGGAGDDTYVVDDAGDQVIENPGEGTDTVESSIALQYQLPDHVENLTLVGTAWGGTGNDGANVIIGNEAGNYILGMGGDDLLIGAGGNDILRGFDGDDMLVGGYGNDWLEGGAGNDIYVRNNETGSDLISDVASAGAGNQLYLAALHSEDVQLDYQGMYLELKSLSGELLVSLTGFSHLDALSPFRAVEEFRFVDGTILNYEQLLARGFDIFGTGILGEDQLEGTSVQDRIYGSSQGEVLAGYQGDDRLLGGGGNDTLHGMEGDDNLFGGEGNDSLLGGVGSDTYWFDRLSGHDTILELVELADDHGDVDSLVFDADILPEDLTASLDSLGRFVISINGSDATILFNEWFNTELSTRVERFVFQDGTVLTDEDVTALLNDAPVLANPLADMAARDAVPFSFTVPDGTFFDDDPGDTLTYAASLAGGGALPSWLTFNAATHTFSGTPGSANIGNAFNVQVTATDSHSESVSDVFTITVDVAPDQTIVGTEGDDILVGASGNDTIFGLGGADRLEGGLGDDTLWGLAGNDVLDGGTGADVMRGGVGDDVYRIDNSGDQVLESANEGIDTIETPFATTLGANIENVTLLGTAAVSALGNDLANVFDGTINGAVNVFTGRGGNDTYYLGAGDSAIESSGGGTDTIVVGSTWILASNFENLTLAGNAAINGTGNSSANILTGNSAANVLAGGQGADTYYVGAGDTVVEVSSAGVDLVVSDVSWTLAAYVENLTLVGTAAIDGTGNGYDNVFIGNSAANVFTGGIGNDTYYVGAGDSVVEASAAGVDTVISDVSVVLWHFVEHLTLTGTADLDGTGTTWHNQITGNAGNNVLSGALGNDTLNGGDGNDTLLGGDDDDTLNGGNGNDSLFGGNDDDFVYGGNGSDTISGDDGNDRIEGDAGNDTLTGGAGTDSFVFDSTGSSSNADVITDFQSVDRILLDHAVMTALGATGNFTPNDQRFWASGSGTPHDPTDRILYNTNTGELWYDPDGVLSMSRQIIATLQDHPTLLASQISVI